MVPLLGFLIAIFTFALCFGFEISDGKILTALENAVAVLLFPPYSFGIVAISSLCSLLIFGLTLVFRTRNLLVGISLLAIILITYTALSSRPSARFRKFVDQSAPANITIIDHEVMTSFSDGTWRTFVWQQTSDYTVEDLVKSTGLSPDENTPGNFPFFTIFEELPPFNELKYYSKPGVGVAYHAKSNTGYAVCH